MMIADNDHGLHGLLGKLSVKVGTRIRLVGLMNILYIQACGDYVDIATLSGEVLHTKEQITRLENRLPAYLFARVHRSYIVNTEYIQEIRTRQNDYDLVLSNGAVIASSSVYRKQLRDRFLTEWHRDAAVRSAPSRGDHSRPELRSIPGGRSRDIKERLRVRTCSPGDEHSLALLGQATFIETYAGLLAWQDMLTHCASHHSPAFYRSWLEDKAARIWMLETETSAAPVGYLALTSASLPAAERSDADLEIQRIYMLERYHDQAAGTQLLAEALQHAQAEGSARLWAADHAKNERALKFYERAGFGTREEYRFRIGDGEYQDLALSLEI